MTGRITDKTVAAKKAAMLASFEETASVTRSCKAVGITRERHYTWMKDDPDYKAKFAVSLERAADRLEDEAVKRAFHGWFEPVIYQGQACVEPIRDENGNFVMDPVTERLKTKPLLLRKRSDVLLMFMLKALRPDKFRETWKGEISGPNGGPIELTDEKLKSLNDDELANLIKLCQKLASPGDPGSGAPPAAAE